jgi:hypothetical protein
LERLLVNVCLDRNHVHGFAGLEAGAGEIDIGVWRVIVAIGREGRPDVRLLVVRGLLTGREGFRCARGSQIKYLRGERFVQLDRRVRRLTQGGLVGYS